ncbi:hypothetical protein ABZ801_01210 [Actinomadura sp. NPDC047616]|uniref:hypothetical protein n=1 Tax=Actinomadura sp. NPDC047616 TaxID=3155914 RepID=UPI003409DD40
MKIRRRRPIVEPIAVYDSHDPRLNDRDQLNAWARAQGLRPTVAYRWEIYRTDHLFARCYEYAADHNGVLRWDPDADHYARATPHNAPLTSLPPDLWMVELPFGLPLFTANDRGGWQVRHTRTRALRTAAAIAARNANIPSLPAAHVIAEYRPGPRTRRRDPANWAPAFKAAADGALVDAQILPDDDAAHLIGPDPRLGPPDPEAAQAGQRWGRIVLYIRARQPDVGVGHPERKAVEPAACARSQR